MAEEIGVTPGALAMWETGARPIPGPALRLIDLYEEALGVNRAERPGPEGELLSEIERALVEMRARVTPEMRDAITRATSEYFKKGPASGAIGHRVRAAVARRIVRSLGEHKGLSMKAAQLASFIHFGLPEEVREILSALQDSSTPMPAEVAARVVCEELGQRPERLFAHWSPKPFAAASIGQVHEARLKTGERVAVKVQYPGIAAKLESGFRKLSVLNHLAQLARPANDKLFEELRARVTEECDFARESEWQETFRQAFEGDPEIFVPKVFHDYSRTRVLTSELVEGLSYRDFLASASQESKNRAGAVLNRFHSQAILRHGLVHADPHPGNYLFTQEGVAFVDFGRVARIPAAALTLERAFWTATLQANFKGFREIMLKLGLVREPEAFDFEEFWRILQGQQAHHLTEGTFEFTPEYVSRIWRLAREFRQSELLHLTGDFFWSIYVNYSLWGMFGALRAKSDWRAQALALLAEDEAAN